MQGETIHDEIASAHRCGEITEPSLAAFFTGREGDKRAWDTRHFRKRIDTRARATNRHVGDADDPVVDGESPMVETQGDGFGVIGGDYGQRATHRAEQAGCVRIALDVVTNALEQARGERVVLGTGGEVEDRPHGADPVALDARSQAIGGAVTD